MKTNILIFWLLLALITNGYSQADGILLKNKAKGKEKVIEDGQYIKVVSQDGSVIRGKLSLRNDSLFGIDSIIIVDHDTLIIAEVNLIKTLPRAFRYSGMILGYVGVIFSGFGVITLFESSGLFLPFIGALVAIVGVSMATTGIIMTTFGNKYGTDKWDMSVINNYPGEDNNNEGAD